MYIYIYDNHNDDNVDDNNNDTTNTNNNNNNNNIDALGAHATILLHASLTVGYVRHLDVDCRVLT